MIISLIKHLIMETIKEESNFNNNQAMLDNLAKCNCCEVHQINKPITYRKWIDLPENKGLNKRISNTNIETNKLYCECDCRHLARWICRKCPS